MGNAATESEMISTALRLALKMLLPYLKNVARGTESKIDDAIVEFLDELVK